jgi:N-acetylmuramoyl-L-alanine amidase
MTRDADVNLSLVDRANVGRDNSADVFMSLHFNGFNGVAHGASMYVRTNGNNQVNYAEDVALGTRVVNAELVANPITDRAQNLNDANFGTMADSSLGNTAAHHKTRACYLEVDFIDVPRVDVTLNTGPDATANREAICNGIANAIIDEGALDVPSASTILNGVPVNVKKHATADGLTETAAEAAH